MNLTRLLTLFAALAALPIAALIAGLDPREAWSPRAFLIVLAAPWVVVAIASGPRRLTDALRLPFAADVDDRVPEQRETAGAVLRELGGLAVALGTASFLIHVIWLLALLGATAGNADPLETVVGLGSALLGPVYGLTAKGLVYDPLATAVEPSPAELAAALD